MKKSRGRPAASPADDDRPGARVRRRARNLTLDPEAVARGESYGRRHGASLSQLVNDFLLSLPAPEGEPTAADLAAPVRRLYGLAAGGATDRDAHRAYLMEKYGSRD